MHQWLGNLDVKGPVLFDRHGSLTRAELEAIVGAIAMRFDEVGLQPGERVALQLPNSCELIAGYYACLCRGLVAVPLSMRMAPAEARTIVRDCGARALLTHGEATVGESENLVSIVVNDLPSPTPRADPASLIAPWDDTHPGVIYYTSGTTGRPKGALYTHGTLRRNGEMVRNAFSIGPEDTMVACQCMAHNFVFAQQVFPVLSAGGSVFVVEFGDVGGTIAALRQDATMIMLIPWFAYRLFEALRAHPLDLPALRMCFVGGDRIDPSLLELGRAATGIPISQNIGMTETNSFAADIGGAPWSKPGSLGRPLPGAEVEIRDDRGKPVSTGTSGQIWVRSPGNMAGYWNNPEATEATLVDGWVATGDAGHFDEDGLLWFDGRIKHIIIHDGDNIYPAEVERAILRHPGVDAVTVFGLPHPRHGEVVAAAIAGSRPTLPEAAALRAFLKEHLSAAKIPCHWLRLRQIPLNRNGKPNIPAIRDALAAQPGFRVGM